MVDSIKSLTKNLEVHRSNSGKTSASGESGPVVSLSKVGGGSTGVDSVDVSSSIATTALADFTKKPPIDVETVSRIKDAIANGDYPIDLDAVADMLLDAYKDMKS